MSRRTKRRLQVGAAVLLLVWVAAAAVLLLLARASGRHAFDQLDQAQHRRTFSALVDPATGRTLHRAADGFDRAHGLVANPVVWPLRALPILGRQIRAADRLDQAAAEATLVAARTADELREATAGDPPAGAERVALLRRTARLASRARTQVAAIDPGPSDHLVASLTDAFDRFTEARGQAVTGLERASSVLTGAADLFEGPSDYLLLGGNNSEMRAGSGMFLSAAPLHAEGGRLTLGDVQPTDALPVSPPVPADPDVTKNWDFIDPGGDFRNLGLTPRFPESAAMATEMWARTGHAPVQGVVAIDVEGLRELLRATGPVTVDGVTYRADNVRPILLNRQYKTFVKQNQERKDRLGAVARAVFDRLEAGHWSFDTLATALVEASHGRHLMLWSADPVQQQAWETAGAAGELDDDSLSLGFVSRSANKVDWFVHAGVKVATTATEKGTDVEVTVRLDNTTPADEPRYVAGPNAPGLAAGEYSAVLVVDAPVAATGLTVEGGEFTSYDGVDGPHPSTGRYLRLPRDQETTLVVRFRLPSRQRSLVLEPTARVPDAVWTIDGTTYQTEQRRSLRW